MVKEYHRGRSYSRQVDLCAGLTSSPKKFRREYSPGVLSLLQQRTISLYARVQTLGSPEPG